MYDDTGTWSPDYTPDYYADTSNLFKSNYGEIFSVDDTSKHCAIATNPVHYSNGNINSYKYISGDRADPQIQADPRGTAEFAGRSVMRVGTDPTTHTYPLPPNNHATRYEPETDPGIQTNYNLGSLFAPIKDAFKDSFTDGGAATSDSGSLFEGILSIAFSFFMLFVILVFLSVIGIAAFSTAKKIYGDF